MAGIFYLEIIMEIRICIAWKEVMDIVNKIILEKIDEKYGLKAIDSEVSNYMNCKIVMHYPDGTILDLDEDTYILEYTYSGLDI
jgi:uncharacterized protein YrrD